MTAQRTESKPQAMSAGNSRRTWKKKTPVEVVLDQEQKLRQEIAIKEEDLATCKRQLQKFEQARKIFETT